MMYCDCCYKPIVPTNGTNLCRVCTTEANNRDLHARVAELEAALQEQTRLRLAEIDLHEEAESAAAATARAEMQERCAKACESFAEITRTPEGAIGAIGAYACAIIIRSLSPTPEPPHA